MSCNVEAPGTLASTPVHVSLPGNLRQLTGG